MIGQMCGFLVCFAVSSSRSNSPSSSRRFLAGDEGGIFNLSTRLDDIINPHSFIAILQAVSDQDEVVMAGASPIEGPTIPEVSDGL